MKRLFTLTVAFTIALTLAACGNKDDAWQNVPSEPSETMPTEDNLPSGSEDGTDTEEPMETAESESEQEQEQKEAPLVLNYDFPDYGKDDDGSNNAPEFVVTLHGGVEVERPAESGNQFIKLEGFGKVEDVNTAYICLYGTDGISFEVPFNSSLSWADLEPAYRQALDLRDDVAIQVKGMASGMETCYPGQFDVIDELRVMDVFYYTEEGIYVYNPTENEIPYTECSISAVRSMASASDIENYGSTSAENVYSLLGEPSCACIRWNNERDDVVSVRYYWVCNGFYAEYTVNAEGSHGSTTGELWYYADTPVAVEYHIEDAAAFMAGE